MDYLNVYKKWKEYENLDADLKLELESLKEDEIKEAFDGELSFGTGGLRGIMGVGTNRINIYTAKKIGLGYANYVVKNYENAKKDGVVICFDNRHNSHKFALEISKIISGLGIRVYLFKELRPTPYLSFAIRYLKAAGGLMITASHNPKKYNGIKAYNNLGGQLNLNESKDAISEIDKIDDPFSINYEGNKTLITPILEKIDKAYFKELKKIKLLKLKKSARILYSPLHATGGTVIPKFLKKLGYNIEVYKPHEKLDPDFTNAKFTNPELVEAWDDIIKYAKESILKPDIIAMSDPDCDRSGFAFLMNDGEYKIINGNVQGVIALNYILNNQARLGALKTFGNVYSTVVTTDLLKDITISFNQNFYYTLTGFKFIGEKIDLTGGSEDFSFACEESIGAIIAPYVRDKDAIPLVLVFANFASYLKNNFLTVDEYLDTEVYQKYGYYLENTINVVKEGKTGAEKIKKVIDFAREKGLKLEGHKLVQILDFLTGEIKSPKGDVIDKLEFPSSNFLKFIFEWGWVVLRPSGTEPKLKIYFSVNTKSKEESEKLLAEISKKTMDLINPILEK